MSKMMVGMTPVLGLMVLLAGCSHTLSGAQQDVSHDAQSVNQAAQNAGTDVKQAATNVKAKAELTPDVKLAIIRDPILNDTRNHINVTSEANTVYIRGHVVSSDMVQRATEDAQKVLSDHHATQTITNELTVSGS